MKKLVKKIVKSAAVAYAFRVTYKAGKLSKK